MPVSTERREGEPTSEVLHMWTPYHTQVGADYDFVPRNPVFRLFSVLLWRLVLLVFPLYNRLFFHLRVKGREKLKGFKGGGVTICNHVHVLDCTMVACCFRTRKLHWPTLKTNIDIPVISTLVRLLGGIPIPRGPHALSQFSFVVKQLLDKGEMVHIYPEGILAPYYSSIRSFRRGAFAYAYDSNVPVIPMVITYREPRHALSRFFHRKPLLQMNILDPIYPRQEGDRREQIDLLRENCFQAMYACAQRENQIPTGADREEKAV